jgi:uncharacterized protein YbdZ (MbtH family)
MPSTTGDDDTTNYDVVVNHEQQYSIWPDYREVPLGWTKVGKSGLKAECLAYIKEVWTDMRPLSLRKKMEEIAKKGPPPSTPASAQPYEDDLFARLCAGSHPVVIRLRPEKTAQALKEAIERGYVHIEFSDTRGGTELAVRIDHEATDTSDADFARSIGAIRIIGFTSLNYAKARCNASIDLQTLSGTGRLEPTEILSPTQ